MHPFVSKIYFQTSWNVDVSTSFLKPTNQVISYGATSSTTTTMAKNVIGLEIKVHWNNVSINLIYTTYNIINFAYLSYLELWYWNILFTIQICNIYNIISLHTKNTYIIVILKYIVLTIYIHTTYYIFYFVYLKYLECSTKIMKLLPPYILQV